MNWFDTILKVKGFPIEQAQKHLNYIQSIPEEKYESFLEKQKQAILKHHLQHTPFYQEHTARHKINRWEEVPILTKTDLQRPLKERLSTAYTTRNVYINKTSGSSGHPFVFAKDKFCHAMTWAIIFNRFGWFGLDFNTSLQARFYGIPLEKMGYYKERIKDKFANRYRFPIFDLNDEKLAEFLAKFYNKAFDYINGYTSSIELFAKYLAKKNIVLKKVCPSLKVCIVTSEMLFPETKQLLENQFGVPVVNEYGASELDLIAFQNQESQWVLNTETLYVEIVDENGAVLPPGQEGRIIVSSLFNKAHPFIRYDLGDIGVLSPNSNAKKAYLERLVGRTNDIARLPSGKVVPGLTFYYVTKSIIEDDTNVKEFVIQQTQPDTFEITYAAVADISIEKQNQIKKAVEKYLEKGLRLNLKRVPFLKRKKRGKLKQFESLV